MVADEVGAEIGDDEIVGFVFGRSDPSMRTALTLCRAAVWSSLAICQPMPFTQNGCPSVACTLRHQPKS
jgi:hypothetical protein